MPKAIALPCKGEAPPSVCLLSYVATWHAAVHGDEWAASPWWSALLVNVETRMRFTMREAETVLRQVTCALQTRLVLRNWDTSKIANKGERNAKVVWPMLESVNSAGWRHMEQSGSAPALWMATQSTHLHSMWVRVCRCASERARPLCNLSCPTEFFFTMTSIYLLRVWWRDSQCDPTCAQQVPQLGDKTFSFAAFHDSLRVTRTNNWFDAHPQTAKQTEALFCPRSIVAFRKYFESCFVFPQAATIDHVSAKQRPCACLRCSECCRWPPLLRYIIRRHSCRCCVSLCLRCTCLNCGMAALCDCERCHCVCVPV
ncbi:hypothetical protein, conserved in T. vivax [Trypanosoma vivax Y486]|uniref:Uncharacterized protein n=1 Tax=Trypanosoma vivax (strain Y486) TaxID=1055687 RepID=F9WQ48_TRYVY|nr:hypothetical protein, conserved in T. vivax [Trypanosoma vivax Y486]|eukprot:CCD19675.1 hypothetical protein, conserved in T. vivax [Trypanosoma vivax Y486]